MPYEFLKFRKALCENFKYHYISAIQEENDCYFFDTTEDIVSLGKTRIIRRWKWNKITKEITSTEIN